MRRLVSSVLVLLSGVVVFSLISASNDVPSDAQIIELSANVDTVEPVSAIQIPDSSQFYFCKYESVKSRVDRFFYRRHRAGSFNGTYLVAEKGRIISKGSHGYSNYRKRKKNTLENSFQLASVSKPITATAIMMLVEKGFITYDDDILDYLPELPYKGITIRMLLTHRSGLGNYTYFSDQLWCDQHQTITNSDVLNLMCEEKPDVYFRPNRRFDYSNTGYMLLACIVERVSKKSFEQFMKDYIFDPLEMNNTRIYNRNKGKEGLVNPVMGYEGSLRRPSVDVYLNGVTGDKGVYSTVEDLLKFDQALYDESLITKATQEEAFSPSNSTRWRKGNYGFGWRLRNLDTEDKIVYHKGWWWGFRSCFIRLPEKQQTIIVLDNVKRGYFFGLNELIDLLPEEKKAI